MPLPITTPLPMAKEGEPAWILSAEMLDLLVRKVEAFHNIQAEAPLRIVKADAGFRFTIEE